VTDPSAPLAGLRVLDLTRVLAGPYCTRLLADLGADVVKIERREGDDTRRGYVQLEPGREDQATYFVRINVGKRSVALDLTRPEARPVVLDLARASDVVVENFVPGVVARLGCDHATLSAVKPDLVYCSISGFGQSGPWRTLQAFAHIISAVSGLMHLERNADAEPRVSYLQAADVLAGTHAFGAICAALLRRGRTGRGAHLDVSMLECLVAAEDITYGAMLNGGAEYPGPRAGMLIHQIDGHWFTVQSVGAPDLWARLLAAMKRPDLGQDPRFATPLARRQNWAELRRPRRRRSRRARRRASRRRRCSRRPRSSRTRTSSSASSFPPSRIPRARACASPACPSWWTGDARRPRAPHRTVPASTHARC